MRAAKEKTKNISVQHKIIDIKQNIYIIRKDDAIKDKRYRR